MGTTVGQIREWLERAKDNNATHMLVVVDSFDYEDYPVEVAAGSDPYAVFTEYNGKSMQRVMECYDLSKDIEPQLLQVRALNF